MLNSRIHVLIAVFFIAIFISGTCIAVIINSDFGKLEVKSIHIEDADKQLTGIMYIPSEASTENPSPAIILAHGISESKEVMTNLGLEIARKSFVVLCLDLIGHGNSGGTVSEGTNETDFGVSAATRYLQTQPYVNSSAIGLVGHSLGGGAVRAEAAKNKNILSTVLVAGGLGLETQNPNYAALNATFPKNLLVIVGKYDVLFNITDLETKELPTAFNTSGTIMPDITYGNFQQYTARKLIVPSTTHIFEPVDPKTVMETVNWLENSLRTNHIPQAESKINLLYPQRETVLLIALIGLIGITLTSYYPITKAFSRKNKDISCTDNKPNAQWRTLAVWAILNLILFFPLISIGFVISFPPLIFGSSMAWWLIVTGLIGILLFAKNKPKLWKTKPELKKTILQNFSRNDIVIAIFLFAIIFTISSLLQGLYTINLRILAPIFQQLTQPRRILAFAAFMPFFLIYFIAEGLYLHIPQLVKPDLKRKAKAGEWAKVVFAKISPFVILIAIQYLPQLFLNIQVLPSFVGFIAEFLWLIVPVFIITTTFSWWLYNQTGTIGTAAVLNGLVFAWIASVTFPF